MTNKPSENEIVRQSDGFVRALSHTNDILAGANLPSVRNTRRQASKWNRGTGTVRKLSNLKAGASPEDVRKSLGVRTDFPPRSHKRGTGTIRKPR